jgi:hypothetical protein
LRVTQSRLLQALVAASLLTPIESASSPIRDNQRCKLGVPHLKGYETMLIDNRLEYVDETDFVNISRS